MSTLPDSDDNNDDNKHNVGDTVKDGAEDDTTTSTTTDNDTVDESILPPVTPAVLEEYQKDLALKAAAAAESRKMKRNSLLQVCGIPSCLMLVLILLIIGVIVGTALSVVFYDPSDGVQPPSDAPSAMENVAPS
ncbi:hypothetical protein IV203_009821 [Nitzschia inconspicua]|uniref:Uncharacterized protein n=1 Tax=Nitzschia inconspicua TaxID=303405 RepID=A0A9K3KWE9_9STRA|nr:hypothetical protein IV203_009821 [Nitzschia inconspicua]